MRTLILNPITGVWLLLASATALSWWLGTGEVADTDQARTTTTFVIMLVAFVKARLVMSYFMEIRHAPWPLRRLCDAWLLISAVVVLGLYVLGTAGRLQGLA
jgi:heme/copper-type cytochrome/quinol oxidase subunit 4